MNARCGLACALLMLAMPVPALERVPAAADEAVRQAMSPFRDLAERLPPELRQRLQQQAELWVGLSPAQQDRLRANLQAWESVPAQDRLRLRVRFEAWQQLDGESRAAALAAQQRYAMLPPAAQLEWRERFDALPAAERRRYLFDPASRNAMALADTLFPFIPADEQVQTIAMLRQFDPAQLEVLRRRLARLPPVRREALRLELLELSPDERMRELGAAESP